MRLLAIPLSILLAAGLAACGGSGGPKPSAATVEQPPLTSTQTTVPVTVATPTTTPQTTTLATTTTAATTTTTPATTTASTQASGGAPAGCPGAVGGFIRNVQARGTDCGHALDVANAWFNAVHGGASPSAPITAGGYACTGALSGERASVTCAGGASGAAISFTASP